LSGFEVGEPLPKLALRPLAGQPAADAPPVAAGVCRLLVFFSVTCEHCHTAARRDAATPDSLRLPTLWVSHTDDPAAASFAAALRGVAPVMYGGPTAFQKMDVLGAPAAFLVMPRGNVRWVGGYVGGAEYHRLVREKC
jgi:mono/diheme cytochrome c family protein